jgi:hypothetical protein
MGFARPMVERTGAHDPSPVAVERHGRASSAIDLYWIPLGAGGHSVRINGVVYEALVAVAGRRPRCDLYHSALEVRAPDLGRFTIEMTPIPDRRGSERGVSVEGPVGSRLIGRVRLFRYEVRCWRDGTIPDLGYARLGPLPVPGDGEHVRRLLAAVPSVPPLVWGRDERRVGEMWNSNSVTSWLLTRAGVDVRSIDLPAGGRAPGWLAGRLVAEQEQLPARR